MPVTFRFNLTCASVTLTTCIAMGHVPKWDDDVTISGVYPQGAMGDESSKPSETEGLEGEVLRGGCRK